MGLDDKDGVPTGLSISTVMFWPAVTVVFATGAPMNALCA